MSFDRRADWCRIAMLSVGLLLTSASSVLAQVPAELTLDQAVAEALERNPSLAVERREIDIAKGVRRQAGIYPFNPELEADGGAGRARDRVNADERRGVDTKSVGLFQTIWLQGQRGLRVRSAQAGVLRAENAVRDVERQVVADTVKAYGELVVSQERLELAREILGVVRQLREAAQKLFEADEVPQLDVFRADVEVLRAENRVAAEERTVAAAQRELALLVGRLPDQALRAVAPSPALPAPRGDIAALSREAFARRADLSAAVAAVQGARAELDLIRAERFFPELRVGLKYEEAREFDSVSQRGLLTVSVPLPLFNRRQGDLDRARGELAKQEAQVELTRRRIEKEVASALQQVEASRRIVDRYARTILPQQERNFSLLREAYALGQLRITDVFVGEREFIEGREAYVEAVAAGNAATADLYRALGAQP
jgi:cobalt-zinc-cadmium efflux system outer membrane protein